MLANWVDELGHQVADAQGHYLDRHGATAWLLIDLGDEPAPGAVPWPARIVWTHFVRNAKETSQVTTDVVAEPTEDGLRRALRAILRAIPPTRELCVDIAMPYELLGKGIEHWQVVEVDGEWETLDDHHSPRLRWSLRRRDITLHGRCAERTARSDWARFPEPLRDALLLDSARLKTWIRKEIAHAWLVGGHPPAAAASPLRVLLREGCGFLIWFPGAFDDRRRQRIVDAVAEISVDARRKAIPDALPVLDPAPVVIWDDPRGRGEFMMPPLVPAEHIHAHQR